MVRVFWLALIFSCVCFIAGCGGTDSNTNPTIPSYVYYWSDKDGSGDIYSVNTNGASLRHSTIGGNSSVSLSRDGRRYTYLHTDVTGKHQTYVVDLDIGGIGQLVSGPGFDCDSADASPFTLSGSPVVFEAAGNIYISNTPGMFQAIVSDGHSRNPKFSPDGARIAFSNDSSGVNHIYTVDLNGNNSLQATAGSNNEVEPNFSPSQQRLYFISMRSGDTSTQVYFVTTSNPNLYNRVTNFSQNAHSPYPTADGKGIFVSVGDVYDDRNIYYFDLNTNVATNLTNTSGFENGFNLAL